MTRQILPLLFLGISLNMGALMPRAIAGTLQEAVAADSKSTFDSKAPGAYLIPGTNANPLATPESLPESLAGQGKVLLQSGELQPGHSLQAHGDKKYSKTLIDQLEYHFDGKGSIVNWDIEHWQGGDYNRWWIKSEGNRNVHSGDYDADFRLLRGKLTAPFTELQYGLRLQTQGHGGTHVARPQAAVGLHALMPYNYDLESVLFVDAKGNISGLVKAEKDLLITQKLILQPRLEAEAALQEVERFGVGKGLNSLNLGLRLRYEIRRELAPYIGINYQKNFGKTASFARENGSDSRGWNIVAGARMWF